MPRLDLMVLALALAACGPEARPATTTLDVALDGLAPLDVLIVVDNSGSMELYQARLAGEVYRFIDALRGDGELPDLRVGIVTSDLGTLDFSTGDAGCNSSDGGALQTSGCPIAGNYLVDGDDVNHTGSLVDAIACMVQVGRTGCGFEQHLEAMHVALSTSGMIREEAALAVLILGDEDDCSASNRLFYLDVDEHSCFRSGVRCDPDDPDTAGPKLGCEPREDSMYLHQVQRYVDALTSIKPNPQWVSIGVIAGPREPVNVVVFPDPPRTYVAASCGDGQGRPAPAIRLAHLAESLGDRGVFGSACDAEYTVLAELGALARRSITQPPCFAAAVTTDCQVELVFPEQGAVALDACAAGSSSPVCWRIVDDPASCSAGAHQRIEVVPPGPFPEHTRLRATCALE